MNYVPLQTEKYFQQDLECRIAIARRVKNKKALRDFGTLLIGIALIPATYYMVVQSPQWVPVVTSFIESWVTGLWSSDAPFQQLL